MFLLNDDDDDTLEGRGNKVGSNRLVLTVGDPRPLGGVWSQPTTPTQGKATSFQGQGKSWQL